MSAGGAFLEHFVLMISIITVQNITSMNHVKSLLVVAGKLKINSGFVI